MFIFDDYVCSKCGNCHELCRCDDVIDELKTECSHTYSNGNTALVESCGYKTCLICGYVS